ncbi:hypothetical protein QBC38DRAFT_504295 [Podospora fimiseda]|uniref:Hsp90 chaperone protein kinase-targeting subunit n=1 Tax=Podospora fimiseda TaxID=252190 RepID=A0AAN6YP88_9PEZI|nr:hypothetical protein QBC38DRAFT_504295 [Podospora fimiseda]
MVLDYSKWDALELSDGSDIEAHSNVDKRSFIRAKQNQIHMEREQRRRQVQALKHEQVINGALLQRLNTLISALQSRHAGSSHGNPNPADIVFQAMMELASTKPEEDSPPPRPDGVFDPDLLPLPTYSKMLAALLDEVSKTLNKRQIDPEQRYEAFIKELGCEKITSESYHVGFDSSSVAKAKPGENSKQETKVELLNPNYSVAKSSSDTEDGQHPTRASPVAKVFGQIPASDYRASRDYLYSHPEILQNESETDGLFMEAYYAMLDQNDEKLGRQYVQQALLLQYCHLLGRDGVSLFFKRMATPGHQAREMFERDVVERFEKIRHMAKRDFKEKSEGVEQVQLYPTSENSSIRIQIPPVESEDEEVRKARSVFEKFSPGMRAALESGSLDEVNKVLSELAVEEAEKMVALLDQLRIFPGLSQASANSKAGCLSIEESIIDATTGEGKKRLQELQEAAVGGAGPTGSAVSPDPE